MTKQGFILGAFALCFGNSLAAQPCVTSTFDTPVPGARNVVTRHVDVPSPQFPGIWQEGVLDGYSYALFANGEGSVTSAQAPSDWEISILCKADTTACTTTDKGTVPNAAKEVSKVLQACLRGDGGPDPMPKQTKADPIKAANAPCGIAAIQQGAPGFTLQRLLVAAGEDPGPIDGLPGSKTRKAVVNVLGERARGLETQATIDALNAFMCGDGG